MRLDAGVSIAELGRVVGVDPSHIARIEKAIANPSLDLLTAIAVALGADLGVRFFAGSGPRLRDRFQAPMVEMLLSSLDARWSAQLEVPITSPVRGVIDVVLTDRLSPIVVAVEAQSELRNLEQQLRWSAEKADGLADRLRREATSRVDVSRLLLLRATVSTRELARRFPASLRSAYPCRSADVVRALTSGDIPWPGPGIAWIRLEDGTARLLERPPRGVGVGR